MTDASRLTPILCFIYRLSAAYYRGYGPLVDTGAIIHRDFDLELLHGPLQLPVNLTTLENLRD